MVNLKRLGQELPGLLARVVRDGRRGFGAADLEDGLQLRAIRERVLARHHLDDQAAQGPNVRLSP